MQDKNFDIVIVGASPAGCICYYDLAKKYPHKRILLLEHGPLNSSALVTKDPFNFGSFRFMLSCFLTSYYHLMLNPGKKGRKAANLKYNFLTGKGVGGGSIVNGSIWARPPANDVRECLDERYAADHKEIFEIEREMGIEMRRFTLYEKQIIEVIRSELNFNYLKPNQIKDDILHQPLFTKMLTAANPQNDRISGYNLIMSTDDENFGAQVRGNSPVDRLIFEGKRAVALLCKDGTEIRAENFVISCGAMHTPLLLKRSGLQNPQIGKNLRDRYGYRVTFLLDEISSFDDSCTGFSTLEIFDRTVQITTENMWGLNNFHRIWLYFMRSRGFTDFFRRFGKLGKWIFSGKNRWMKLLYNNGFEIVLKLTIPDPAYTGQVELDEDGSETSYFPYFASPKDRSEALRAFEIIKILRKAPMFKNSFCLIEDNEMTEENLPNFLQNAWHFAGTCAMGSVVDETFKVKDLDNVHIVDMSVCKRSSSVNSMAMAFLLGRIFSKNTVFK